MLMVRTEAADPEAALGVISGTVGDAVGAALDAGVRRLLGAVPEVRRGDVEALHQMRVGRGVCAAICARFAACWSRSGPNRSVMS